MSEQVISLLPSFAEVVGRRWLSKPPEWFRLHVAKGFLWLRQLESDLALLAGKVPISRLGTCYGAMLRDCDGFFNTIFEIHGATLLASIATRVKLHAPLAEGSGRNFDVRAETQGYIVNAESKTRTDNFPLTVPRGPEGHFGTRPTLDPHEAADLGLPVRRPVVEDVHFKETPESTEIRQRLLDALSQLPASGYNLVLFGQIQGSRHQLERALYGGEFLVFDHNHVTKQETTERGPGAFTPGPSGDPFERLTAVLQVCLLRFSGGSLVRAYELYSNPRANQPLPSVVEAALRAAMAQWTTVQESEIAL